MVGQSAGGFVLGDFSGYSRKGPYVRLHSPFRDVVRGTNTPPMLIGSAASALANALHFNIEVSQQSPGSLRTLRRVKDLGEFLSERLIISFDSTTLRFHSSL
jgi:hypothetical protein